MRSTRFQTIILRPTEHLKQFFIIWYLINWKYPRSYHFLPQHIAGTEMYVYLLAKAMDKSVLKSEFKAYIILIACQ